jgi:hypothetical protein
MFTFGIGMAWNAKSPLHVAGFWRSSFLWTIWYIFTGIALFAFLAVLVLKLDAIIDVSWLVVFLPFWTACGMFLPIGVG